jgi:uncharacterized damage-inducible protein DinB
MKTGEKTMPSHRESWFEDFEFELDLTHKVLMRLPQESFAWKPHDKSMHLGQLAAHVANLVNWFAMTIQLNELDLASYSPPDRRGPATSDELLSLFDKNAAAARTAFSQLGEAALDDAWTLRMGERVLKTLPRRRVLRTMCLSHMIHHRAQLLVYLRMLNVSVPAVYGPSADEAA